MANAPEGVTRVYIRKIKPGHEQQYDDWLRRYLALEKNARGYLGTTVIVPGESNSDTRYVVHRFADNESLEEWERTEQATTMLDEVNQYSVRQHETATGMETWFKVPGTKAVVAPPKWKMAIMVFAAAFIISTISRSLLNPYLETSPMLLSNAIFTAILVITLTFAAMPGLSRLFRNWLYP